MRAGETDHLTMEYRYRHPQRGEIWLRHSLFTAADDDPLRDHAALDRAVKEGKVPAVFEDQP